MIVYHPSRPGGPSPKKKVDDDGKVVITADNPISCLFEYSKKVRQFMDNLKEERARCGLKDI